MGTIPKYAGDLKIIRADEWSALYVDGELAKVGDHYLIDEFIQLALGVEWHHGDHFLKTPHEAWPTWTEVEQEEARRQDLRDRATALREQAKALETEASLMEAKAR